jgi:hypothetical protein
VPEPTALVVGLIQKEVTQIFETASAHCSFEQSVIIDVNVSQINPD